MDIVTTSQVLGNIGEFIGAIAVVVTLAYLAVQVRHGKEATDTNTRTIRANFLPGHAVQRRESHRSPLS